MKRDLFWTLLTDPGVKEADGSSNPTNEDGGLELSTECCHQDVCLEAAVSVHHSLELERALKGLGSNIG